MLILDMILPWRYHLMILVMTSDWLTFPGRIGHHKQTNRKGQVNRCEMVSCDFLNGRPDGDRRRKGDIRGCRCRCHVWRGHDAIQSSVHMIEQLFGHVFESIQVERSVRPNDLRALTQNRRVWFGQLFGQLLDETSADGHEFGGRLIGIRSDRSIVRQLATRIAD